MSQRATEQSTGSGLGLFIVKKSLAKLQAKVSIDSDEGVGTSISITPPNIVAIQD